MADSELNETININESNNESLSSSSDQDDHSEEEFPEDDIADIINGELSVDSDVSDSSDIEIPNFNIQDGDKGQKLNFINLEEQFVASCSRNSKALNINDLVSFATYLAQKSLKKIECSFNKLIVCTHMLNLMMFQREIEQLIDGDKLLPEIERFLMLTIRLSTLHGEESHAPSCIMNLFDLSVFHGFSDPKSQEWFEQVAEIPRKSHMDCLKYIGLRMLNEFQKSASQLSMRHQGLIDNEIARLRKRIVSDRAEKALTKRLKNYNSRIEVDVED